MLRLKKTIIQAAIQRQEMVVADFRQRIAEATTNDGNVNEEEYDNQKQAFESQVLSDVSLLSEQLAIAIADLDLLQKTLEVRPMRPERIAFGKVVKTNKKTFFVAISQEEFEVNGEMIYGISIKSPIYKSMEGKKTGDRFMQNGVVYQIKDIF